jgi:hypothetical protein
MLVAAHTAALAANRCPADRASAIPNQRLNPQDITAKTSRLDNGASTRRLTAISRCRRPCHAC